MVRARSASMLDVNSDAMNPEARCCAARPCLEGSKSRDRLSGTPTRPVLFLAAANGDRGEPMIPAVRKLHSPINCTVTWRRASTMRRFLATVISAGLLGCADGAPSTAPFRGPWFAAIANTDRTVFQLHA